MNHTPQLHEAIRLLRCYTSDRFDLWVLSGPEKASCRAHIMSTLKGVKTPQSKSGVMAIREEFYKICRPEGSCSAAQEDFFIIWAKGIAADPDAPEPIKFKRAPRVIQRERIAGLGSATVPVQFSLFGSAS